MTEDVKKRRSEHDDLVNYFSKFPESILNNQKRENVILSKNEFKEGITQPKSRPYRIIIDPTNFCNLKCALCSTGNNGSNRNRGHMTLEDFYKVIDKIKDYAIEMYLTNWGESTLHKELINMIEYASKCNIFTFLSTNFSLKYSDDYFNKLIESGLNTIHVDVDGITQEVYEKYRKKGNISLVLENLNRLLHLRNSHPNSHLKIRTSLIANQYNEPEIPEYLKLMESFGVDEFTVDNLQINPKTSKDWLPKNNDYIYSNYRKLDETITPCQRLWSEMTINWDGKISACCVVDDVKADFADILSLNEPDLHTVWNSPHFISARSFFSEQEKSEIHTICHECKNKLSSPDLARAGKESFSIKLKSS